MSAVSARCVSLGVSFVWPRWNLRRRELSRFEGLAAKVSMFDRSTLLLKRLLGQVLVAPPGELPAKSDLGDIRPRGRRSLSSPTIGHGPGKYNPVFQALPAFGPQSLAHHSPGNATKCPASPVVGEVNLNGEAIMKRDRVLQVFLAVMGVLFIALIYPLYTDLWHAKWLLEMHNETEPMFLSFFIALGPFLLIAARNPPAHRSLIAFTAWWSLAHAAVMTIETVQAWNRGVHRDFTDVVITAALGLALLALSPMRRDPNVALSR